MPEARYLLGQLITFIFFAIGIGYFSNAPSYTYHDPDLALIKLSFSHASQHLGECRRFSPEEIAALAPNMRRPMDCPRERSPVYVELILDNQTLLNKTYTPTGLANDGATSVYEKISIDPGEYQLKLRMRDSNREQGFDYEKETTIMLYPQRQFVIDFRDELGEFVFL